jgi:hypothetical protein
MCRNLILLFTIIGLFACKREDNFSREKILSLNQQDSLAIIDIYNKTGGGSEWAYSWDLHNIKTWNTVTIREIDGEYRVVGFQLVDVNPSRPTGKIPESICDLVMLEDLLISSEKLYGELPSSIYKLTKLRNLTIQSTSLTVLPPETGQLKNLKSLYLYFNNFEGEMPKELGNLPPDTKIRISHNKFSGTVPLDILKGRKEIILDYNNFTELPWECWLSDEYAVPSMMYNRLSGVVPDEVKQSKKWVYSI